MNTIAAIAFSIAITAWAVAAWDIARKWVAQRPAALLVGRVEKLEVRDGVLTRAIENLAKELAGEVQTLKAQQVGVLSNMSAANRPRSFQR
jgi:hypothetical protein